ncbi:MAG: PadR family transcriptional regulator [Ilumatobacteraceae bacterium]
MPTADSLLAREVVLALLVEQPRHGWALQRELAPGSEIGRAWTLSRQLVYRTVDNLVDEGLARKGRRTEGDGPERVVLSPTAAGRKHALGWLDEPVEHVREVRTVLLVKLVLRRRMGLASTRFLSRQRRTLAPLAEAIVSRRDGDEVDRWRAESAAAAMRFLDSLPA